MSTNPILKRGDHVLPHQCQVLRRDLHGERIAKTFRDFGTTASAIRLTDEMMAQAAHPYEYKVFTPEAASTPWTAFETTDEFVSWLTAYRMSVHTGSENEWPDPGEPFEVLLPDDASEWEPLSHDIDFTFWPWRDVSVYETTLHALYWAVQRGIWHLDVPGTVQWNNEPLKKDWREYIDLDALDVMEEDLCILGQLRGHGFTVNVAEYTVTGNDGTYPSALGCKYFPALDSMAHADGMNVHQQYKYLTAFWRVLIPKSAAYVHSSTASRLEYLFSDMPNDLGDLASAGGAS